MGWKAGVFAEFSLYAVTDITTEGSDILKKIERAFRGGADIIQLRSKTLTDAALIRLSLQVNKISQHWQKLFFVNDRVDIALATGADGVHLGQDDMPVCVARKLAASVGRRMWLGKSTHNLQQARIAVSEGVDYIGVGPVFVTPTKAHAKSVGLRFVQQAARHVRIPWVAIGGIDLKNISNVLAAGASRVAVVRAIFEAGNTYSAARGLKNKLEGK